MRFLTVVLVLAAGAMLWLLVGIWSAGSERSSASLVDEALTLLDEDQAARTAWAVARAQGGGGTGEAPTTRFEQSVRCLDLALEFARRDGDVAAQRRALSARADAYRAHGAWSRAADDYEELLRDYAPRDPEIAMRLAEALMNLDDLQRSVQVGEDLVASQPWSAGAHIMLGRALMRRGDAALAAGWELLDRELPGAQAAAAYQTLKRAAALDLDDPLRGALIHDLRAAFGESAAAQAQAAEDCARAAGEDLLRARAAYVESLQTWIQRDAVMGTMELVARSGRLPDAVDFGLGALNHEAMTGSILSLARLAEALEQLGRPRASGKIIEKALASPEEPPLEFLPLWCKTLMDGQLWPQLEDMATKKLAKNAGNDAVYRSYATFFEGAAFLNLGRPIDATTALAGYVRTQPFEPFDGALPMAWSMMAEAARQSTLVQEEISCLEQVVRVDRDFSGEAWQRLGELQVQTGASAQWTEGSFANALRLMPEREEQLLPRWQTEGQRWLLEGGFDLELIRTNLRREDRWYPYSNESPFLLLSLAETHRAAGEPSGAIEVALFVLTKLGGFLPAYDVLVEVNRELERLDAAAEWALVRLEHGPLHQPTLEFLRGLDPALLGTGQTSRLMRLDPRHTGLLTLAQSLRAGGALEAARAALQNSDLEAVGGRGWLLLGEVRMELGDHQAAGAALQRIRPDEAESTKAVRLRVECDLALRDASGLAALAEEAIAARELDPHELAALARLLIARGEPAPALRLLEHLDGQRESRSGDGLALLGCAELLLGDLPGARDDFGRAQAFSGDGAGPLGALLTALEECSWSQLPALARALRAELPGPDDSSRPSRPLTEVALEVYEEHLEGAAGLAEDLWAAADAAPAADAQARARAWLAAWCVARLRGSAAPTPSEDFDPGQVVESEARRLIEGTPSAAGAASGPQDPRQILGYLMAAEDPRFAPYSTGALQRFGGLAQSGAWPAWLRAAGLARDGEHALAAGLLRTLCAQRPKFAPAWDLFEQLELARLGRADHPELLALRAERRAALGARPGEEAEQLLVRARDAERQGELAKALELARKSQQSDPGLAAAALAIARLEEAAGDLGAAALSFGRYLTMARPADAAAELPAMLDLLARAQADGSLPITAAQAQLEAMTSALSDDPLPVLALAHLDLAQSASPALGIGRAFARLERFRQAHREQPLEDLRLGSARAWFEFYLRHDPRRARAMAELELTLDPGHVEPWVLLGEALEALGLRNEALEHYETVSRMIPEARVYRHIAVLVAELGSNHEVVESALERAAKLEGLPRPDSGMEFVRARSIANSGPQALPDGIERLRKLWARRAQPDLGVALDVLGQRLGTSLLHQSPLPDGAAGEARAVLEEILPLVADRGRADLIRALIGLAKVAELGRA